MNAISRRPRRGCVWLLALGLLILEVALATYASAIWRVSGMETVLESIVDGMMIAPQALLACWLTWGSGRFVQRILIVLVMLTVSTTAYALLHSMTGTTIPILLMLLWTGLAGLTQVFLAHAVMMPLQLSTKWDLRFSDKVPPPSVPTRQWSLMDVLAWTTSVALPLTFVKLSEQIDPTPVLDQHWVVWQLPQWLHVALTCAALYAVFFVEHRWQRRAMVVAVIAVIDLLGRVAVSRHFGESLSVAYHPIGMLAMLATAYLIGWLLRACGVVLYRPSANEAALAQAVAGGNSTSA